MAVILASAALASSGWIESLHALYAPMLPSSAKEPGTDFNLGDCLRQTDRSQWPAAYAAICRDLRSGVDAETVAPAKPEDKPPVPPKRKASTRDVPAPVQPVAYLPPVPLPLANPALERATFIKPESLAKTAPPPCVIGTTGTLTIGSSGRAARRRAHILVSPQTGHSAAGIALGVPTACNLRSPAAGRILFAGEFKGYRGVVIMGLAQGRHLVVAGLGSLNVKRGDMISRGDSLGMSATERAPALATAFGGDDASLIFFDMRNREGKAEALPWFPEAS